MRLDGRLLLLFLVVSLVFGRLISASSRSAVHAVLIGNLESSARTRTEEISRSMEVGLRAGNEELLIEYLTGCLGSFRASYAAAVGPDGKVTAAQSATGIALAVGDTATAGEFELGGRPVHQLVFPARGGGLVLG